MSPKCTYRCVRLIVVKICQNHVDLILIQYHAILRGIRSIHKYDIPYIETDAFRQDCSTSVLGVAPELGLVASATDEVDDPSGDKIRSVTLKLKKDLGKIILRETAFALVYDLPDANRVLVLNRVARDEKVHSTRRCTIASCSSEGGEPLSIDLRWLEER